MSDNNQLQKQLNKNTQIFSYENKLSDISTSDHEGFITDNLLLHETTLDSLNSTLEEELDEVSYFTGIKAKQRIYDDKDKDPHSAEYVKGQKAIEILTDKESHRNMSKRENKMAESSRRLNLANSAAIAMKKKYSGPIPKKNHFKELKNKVKDAISMYGNIHSADRYFAEAVANNKFDEGKLKARADINYCTKLFYFFLRELSLVTDEKEKDFLVKEQKIVMAKLRSLTAAAERKYGLGFSTEIILSDTEKIDDSKDFYKKEKKDIKTVYEEIDDNIAKFNNKEELNKDSAVGDWQSSNDTKTLYSLELKKSELGDNDESIAKIDEQEKLLKENLVLEAISDKYAKSVDKEDAKLSKKNPEDHVTYLKGTAAYTRLVKQFENQFRTQIDNQFKIITLDNEIRSMEDNKDSKIKPEDMGIYHVLRQYELIKKKSDTTKSFKDDINSNDYVRKYDISFEGLILDLEKIERSQASQLKKMENSIVEQYKILNKIDMKESVDFSRAYKLFRNSVKINGVPMEKYDAEQSKNADIKYYKAQGYENFSEKSLEFIQLGKNSSSIYKERYFLQGSLAEKKYTKEFESLFKPIKLGEDGEVLEEFKKNDEFNKNLVSVYFESDIDVTQRRNILNDFIDTALNYKVNSYIFTLKYVTKSQDNFLNYLKVRDFFRDFESTVLGDPINKLIVRTDETGLQQKLEQVSLISEIVNAQANQLSLDLNKVYSIDDSFNVVHSLSQKEYEEQIKPWNKIFREKMEAYNSKNK